MIKTPRECINKKIPLYVDSQGAGRRQVRRWRVVFFRTNPQPQRGLRGRLGYALFQCEGCLEFVLWPRLRHVMVQGVAFSVSAFPLNPEPKRCFESVRAVQLASQPCSDTWKIISPNTVNTRFSLGHFQVGSYRYSSLIEGLYTLWKPFRSPIYPKLPTWIP